MKDIEELKPPPLPFYGDHWELGLDPWHIDAFPDELKGFAPNQNKKRNQVWLLIDWCGNVIGTQNIRASGIRQES